MLVETRIPFKFIFNKINIELLFVGLYAIIVGLVDENKIINIEIPIAITAIIGTAISLLLTFRTNQGYDRWWEARIVWGAIVNDSRTLTRQLLSFVSDESLGEPDTQRLVRQMTHRQIAFCYSLGQSLRALDAATITEDFITADEHTFIRQHANIPNALLLLHGKTLKTLLASGRINPFQQAQIDDTIRRLCDSMGKCERIKNTVFPTMYSLIVHFFVYLFIVMLPFGIVRQVGLSEAPIVIAIATIFFLIEKTGLYLQDPFDNKPTDTPVTAIARTIEINLKQMLDEASVPQPLTPEDYYLM